MNDDKVEPFSRTEFDALVKEKESRDTIVLFSLRWDRLVATVRSGFAADVVPERSEGP